MAKSNARDQQRRAVAERLRQQQARQERLRSMLILGACILVVVGLLAAALIPYLQQRRDQAKADGTPLADLGASTAVAACDPLKKTDASGNGDHVTIGQKIEYSQAPPSFGRHWGNFLQGSEIRNFYTPQDRPEIERLVHSLEHGHTILWYDETVTPGTDTYQQIKTISEKFSAADYFMAAPWNESDGGAFPSGKHVALTHWTGPDKQQGITQYCAAPSGAVVKKFTDAYPPSDAPEPGAA